MIEAALSAVLFFLIPLSYGSTTSWILNKLWKVKNLLVVHWLILGHFLVFIGLLTLRFMLVKTGAVQLWPIFLNGFTWLSLALLPVLVFRLQKLLNTEFLLVLVVALVAGGLARSVLSFRTPNTLNWDLFEHQTLVWQIESANINFFTSEMSDSFIFNAYPPLIHSSMAVSQHTFNQSPEFVLHYWMFLDSMMSVLVGLTGYYFAYAITKNRWISLLSLLSSALFFESSMAFSSYFFLPQTYVAVLGLLFLASMFNTRHAAYLTVLTGFLLIFFHYVIGSVLLCLLLVTQVYLRHQQLVQKLVHKYPVLEFFFGLGLVGIWTTYQINLSNINSGESQHYLMTVGDKFHQLTSFYGYFGLFFMLGIVTVWRGKIKNGSFLAVTATGMVILLFSNIPYIFKLLSIFRYWFILLFSIGVWSLLKGIKNKVTRVTGVGLLILVLTVNLLLNAVDWKQWLLTNTGYAHFGAGTLEVAQFLHQSYYGKNVSMFSDPSTQNILEGLSGINTVGGAVPDREEFFQVLNLDRFDQMVGSINSLQDRVDATKNDQKLFVVSGKTRLWANADQSLATRLDWYLWQPHLLTMRDWQFISALMKHTNSHLVFANQEYVVIELADN